MRTGSCQAKGANAAAKSAQVSQHKALLQHPLLWGLTRRPSRISPTRCWQNSPFEEYSDLDEALSGADNVAMNPGENDFLSESGVFEYRL